jgi:hypothetical protein
MLRRVLLLLTTAVFVAGASAQENRPAMPVTSAATAAPVRTELRGDASITDLADKSRNRRRGFSGRR